MKSKPSLKHIIVTLSAVCIAVVVGVALVPRFMNGSFFGDKSHEAAKAAALAAEAEEAALMAKLSAQQKLEQQQAALGGTVYGKQGQSGLKEMGAAKSQQGDQSADQLAASNGLGKKVSIQFAAGERGDLKGIVRKRFKVQELDEDALSDESDSGFEFSSAPRYSHNLGGKQRKGVAGAIDEDLLIVEGTLENRLEMSR